MARRLATLVLLLPLLLNVPVSALPVQPDQLQDRTLTLSNNNAAQTSTWEFGGRFTASTPLASMSFQICSNDPLPNTTCDVPIGLDMRNAVLADQTGNIGFSVSPLTTPNTLVLVRNGSNSNQVLSTYEVTGIINPSDDGSYFSRGRTFQTSFPAGDGDFYAPVAFVINPSIQVTATVPPYLLFCVGKTVNGGDCEDVIGNFVDFGELTSRQASQGTTQMLAATNAIDGYTVRVSGPTMTSGNNTISNLVGSDTSRPGTSQFGMNLRANSSPQGGQDATGSGVGLPTNGYNQVNNYRFNSGDVVAASTAPDLARKYTSTYIINVPTGQAPGAYVSTLTYIALGSF